MIIVYDSIYNKLIKVANFWLTSTNYLANFWLTFKQYLFYIAQTYFIDKIFAL